MKAVESAQVTPHRLAGGRPGGWACYAAYKASGIPRLPQIPSHWQARQLRHVVDVRLSNVDKKTVEGQEAVRLCNYTDVYYHDHITFDLDFMEATATTEQIARFKLYRGDVLITKDSETPDDIGVPSVVRDELADVVCGYHLALLRPAADVYGPYLASALASSPVRDQLYAAATGVTRFGLSRNDICVATVPLPPLAEQRAIAAFLDRETARIDALIEKKRRLIELLHEKRAAIVSSAVTRGLPPAVARVSGLNPEPSTKHSGVSWIGDVPKHWSQPCKLSHLSAYRRHSFVNGPFGSDLLTSEIVEDGVPIVYIKDISSGAYRRLSESCLTPEKAAELDFCRVDAGDVLVAKVGDPPGTSAVYPEGEHHGIVTQDVIRIRVHKRKVSPRFLVYFLNSKAGRGLIDSIAIESTRMRVSLADFKRSLCVLPPLEEQLAIADYLEREAAKIDTLVGKVKIAIDRLLEYRSAQVAAAVTGQIDVREAA